MRSNVQKVVRNSSISVIAQVLTMVLGLIGRRIFVYFLDIEYLGYNSLFGNIFTILSIAELGIGTVITFRLYPFVNNNNTDEIGRLMYLYKWLYRVVAGIVLVLGLIISFFVPFLVKDSSISKSLLYKIYYLQLASVVFGFFLSYRRIIFYVHQQEYRCVQIDLFVNFLCHILQITVLWLTHNYIAYLVLTLLSNLVANFIIKIKSDKEFPYLKEKYAVSKDYVKSIHFFSDMGNFLIHKISYAVYSGTDNVIISAFCGIRMVAFYGNYSALTNGFVNALLHKLLNPVQATIGSVVHSNRSKQVLWEQFKVLDLFGFFIASYISMGFLIFLQPTIQIWMGKEYLLPFSFVVCYVITIYYGVAWEIVYKYRSVFGEFEQDRNLMILSAIMNIATSIPGAIFWGVTGVQIGTLVAFFPIAYGRIRFVIKNFFNQSISGFFAKHVYFSFFVIIQGLICWAFTKNLSVSALGIVMRGLIWLLVPGIICFCCSFKRPEFKRLMSYFYSVIKGLKKSKKEENAEH